MIQTNLAQSVRINAYLFIASTVHWSCRRRRRSVRPPVQAIRRGRDSRGGIQIRWVPPPPPPVTLTVSGVHSAAQSQSFHQIVRHTGMRGRGGLDKTTLVRHPLVTTTIILHFDQDILVVTSWRELDGREEANLNVGRWYIFWGGDNPPVYYYTKKT